MGASPLRKRETWQVKWRPYRGRGGLLLCWSNLWYVSPSLRPALLTIKSLPSASLWYAELLYQECNMKDNTGDIGTRNSFVLYSMKGLFLEWCSWHCTDTAGAGKPFLWSTSCKCVTQSGEGGQRSVTGRRGRAEAWHDRNNQCSLPCAPPGETCLDLGLTVIWKMFWSFSLKMEKVFLIVIWSREMFFSFSFCAMTNLKKIIFFCLIWALLIIHSPFSLHV